jgi:hypothetical protein
MVVSGLCGYSGKIPAWTPARHGRDCALSPETEQKSTGMDLCQFVSVESKAV